MRAMRQKNQVELNLGTGARGEAKWFDVHSVLVKRLPQVKAYTQNLIFDRSHGRGNPAKYEELPIDGIVELWFEDADFLTPD